MQNPVSLIASMFALCAFVVALIAGLAAENAGAIILRNAIAAMLVAYVVASAVGSVARGAVLEHMKRSASAPAVSVAPGTTDGAAPIGGAPDVAKVVPPQIS